MLIINKLITYFTQGTTFLIKAFKCQTSFNNHKGLTDHVQATHHDTQDGPQNGPTIWDKPCGGESDDSDDYRDVVCMTCGADGHKK